MPTVGEEFICYLKADPPTAQGRRNRSGCSGFGRTNILSFSNIFFKKTKKNTYRNVDLYRYRSSSAGVVKRHFDGYLIAKVITLVIT